MRDTLVLSPNTRLAVVWPEHLDWKAEPVVGEHNLVSFLVGGNFLARIRWVDSRAIYFSKVHPDINLTIDDETVQGIDARAELDNESLVNITKRGDIHLHSCSAGSRFLCGSADLHQLRAGARLNPIGPEAEALRIWEGTLPANNLEPIASAIYYAIMAQTNRKHAR